MKKVEVLHKLYNIMTTYCIYRAMTNVQLIWRGIFCLEPFIYNIVFISILVDVAVVFVLIICIFTVTCHTSIFAERGDEVQEPSLCKCFSFQVEK